LARELQEPHFNDLVNRDTRLTRSSIATRLYPPTVSTRKYRACGGIDRGYLAETACGDLAPTIYLFCSFLALVLRQELERRVEEHSWTLEWADIIRDLDHLDHTTITVDDHRDVVRSEIKGTLSKVFHAAGVSDHPPSAPPDRYPETPAHSSQSGSRVAHFASGSGRS
jgi:hypothetical protein